MQSAQDYIQFYNMQPHPEGGYFREIYRASNVISGESLSKKYPSARCSATSIYFLLHKGQISRFHQLTSDELWYYHIGDSLIIHMFEPSKGYSKKILGPNCAEDEHLQVVLPQGTIFGAELHVNLGFSLVGCMVTPGFDFADFHLNTKEELMPFYAQKPELIDRFFK